jgi:hypothetical protein
MDSRGFLLLLLLPIRPMCVKGITRKKAQCEKYEHGACHHAKVFFLVEVFFCRNPTLRRVRMKLTLPKWGLGSPPRLSKV